MREGVGNSKEVYGGVYCTIDCLQSTTHDLNLIFDVGARSRDSHSDCPQPASSVVLSRLLLSQ